MLLGAATELATVDEAMARTLTPEAIDEILSGIPAAWLSDGVSSSAYRRYLLARLEAPRVFVQEAISAR